MIEFGLIEKSIQHYKHLSMPELILDRLLQIQRNPRHLYPFWRLLVLLKWSFIYSKEGKFKRKANQHDLDKLIALTEKFEAEYSIIQFNDSKKVKQFFRIIAYQQFAHQEHYSNSLIDRQLVLYKILDKEFKIQNEFRKLTGIDLISFFNYCYLTYLYLNMNQLGGGRTFTGSLDEDFFKYFEEKFGKDEMDKFLDLLSIRSNDDFNDLHRLKKEILQLYETNFFVTKPFLYFQGNYRIPHRAVFLQTICHFVYNFLKRKWSSFPDVFGYILEGYVGLGLKESGLAYKTATQIKKEYNLGKNADFFVSENILIEVKATELHPRSGVTRTSEMLQDDLKSSVVKGYSQLISTANVINKKQSWYGIIITYKEMYLGFGSDAWEEFLQEPTELFIRENNILLSVLPPENLFIVSATDWDWIVQVIRDEITPSLQDLLEYAKSCNLSNDPQKQVFMMEQVLRNRYHIKQFNLSYLNEAHAQLNILPENE